jgi:hypothetical protein
MILLGLLLLNGAFFLGFSSSAIIVAYFGLTNMLGSLLVLSASGEFFTGANLVTIVAWLFGLFY